MNQKEETKNIPSNKEKKFFLFVCVLTMFIIRRKIIMKEAEEKEEKIQRQTHFDEWKNF